MTEIEQRQLPKPSLAWTLPPDLGTDETRRRCIAIVPGSGRAVRDHAWAFDVKTIGWVRGRFEAKP